MVFALLFPRAVEAIDLLSSRLRARVLPAGERDGPAWLDRWLTALGVSTRFADHGLADPDRAIADVIGSPRGRNFIGAAG